MNHCFSCSSDLITSIDEQSGSIIKLNNGIILYLREINQFLALVCILRVHNFARQAVIDYNFMCLHEAIHQIFAVRLSKKTDTFNYNHMNDDEYEQKTNGNLTNGNGRQPNEVSPKHANAHFTNYLLQNKFRMDFEN